MKRPHIRHTDRLQHVNADSCIQCMVKSLKRYRVERELVVKSKLNTLDHDLLIKQINAVDQANTKRVLNPDYELIVGGVNALGFLHDLYHEYRGDDC